MGNKGSKGNVVDPIEYDEPQGIQNLAEVEYRRSKHDVLSTGRVKTYKRVTCNDTKVEEYLGSTTTKLDLIHRDIESMMKKLDNLTTKEEDQSNVKNFERYVTVAHILQWIEDWKVHGTAQPPSKLEKERMDIVIDYISNTRGDVMHFHQLLEDEKDEELRKFLNDELNPSRQNARPKFSLNAVANAIRFSNKIAKTLKTRQVLDFDIPPHLEKYSKTINSFEFDIFEFEKDCPENRILYYMSLLAFRHLELLSKFPISMSTLKACLINANNRYHKNPYHSETHVADVLQTVVFFLSGKRIKELLSPIDILALIIAVIFHDIDHPGVSNVFEQNTLSERAIRYNDVSVLENHHCATAFEILLDKEIGLFQFFKDSQRIYLRKAIIFLILGTDISHHFAVLNTLKETLFTSFDSKQEDHILLVMKMLVKAADVSNPSKPIKVSSIWAERINEEFYQQGDREKELNLPISAFCNRENPAVAKSQIGFMQYIVKPLFSILTEFDPTLAITMTTMKNNETYWQAELVKSNENAA